jgi:hypothetical protein
LIKTKPKATIIAFDVVRYLYTSAALNSLYRLFPTRDVLLIAGPRSFSPLPHNLSPPRRPSGDSTKTIPRASKRLAPNCNLIFVDGGHTTDIALADIVNMRALANQTFHRVIIDDGLFVSVKSAIDQATAQGILGPSEETVMNATVCLRSSTVGSGVERGKEKMYRKPDCVSNDSFQDALIITSYLFP